MEELGAFLPLVPPITACCTIQNNLHERNPHPQPQENKMPDTKTETTPKLLTRQRVTEYFKTTHGIGISPLTLDKYASQGSGPAYYKFGSRRVYYYPADIDAWVQMRLGRPFRSTSDEAWGGRK
jgi:predicted DNA-binding transcriptional regulator AlpA